MKLKIIILIVVLLLQIINNAECRSSRKRHEEILHGLVVSASTHELTPIFSHSMIHSLNKFIKRKNYEKLCQRFCQKKEKTFPCISFLHSTKRFLKCMHCNIVGYACGRRESFF